MKNLFNVNSRKKLIYLMFFMWVVFGVCGFYHHANFLELSAYFAAFSGPAMTYIWGETRRPHDDSNSSS